MSPSPSELTVVEEDGAEAACDPYHAFGHLAVYPKVPEWNTWVPFDRECKAPALFRSLRTELGIESEEIKEINANEEELNFKDSWTQESLDFMSGRNVLLFGDSTSRNQVSFSGDSKCFAGSGVKRARCGTRQAGLVALD